MKIAIYTPDADLINFLNKYTKSVYPNGTNGLLSKEEIVFVSTRTEKSYFEFIDDEAVETFAILATCPFAKKAVDAIKRKNKYTPVIIFGELKELKNSFGADFYMPLPGKDGETFNKSFIDILSENLFNYYSNFGKLQKLTAKISDVIEFDNGKYDPSRRTLFYNGKEIKKLSTKEGGIIEALSSNYRGVVKKEIILEKVWGNSDYFSSRSMDVYITNLRKLFAAKNVGITIKNISGIGLIME